MGKYNSQDFIKAFTQKTGGGRIPQCPYCGATKFTTMDQYATILIGTELGNINLGPSVPSGMLICEKCGHIEFFALGVLGLLSDKGDAKNGDK